MQKLFYLSLFLCSLAFVSCHRQPLQVTQAVSETIVIDSTLDSLQDEAYLCHLQPIRDSLTRQLDIPLGYAPKDLPLYKPECPLLNWASDALYNMAGQVTDMPIDFAVVNFYGLRTEWGQGNITSRHVFELMPFDNRLVVLTLSGADVLDLCECFAKRGGEGVSHTLRMQIQNDTAVNVLLKGKPVDLDANYYVATSDYLSTGADQMDPLARFSHKEETDLRIRDLYIQYIEQLSAAGKPIEAAVDNRMKQLQ